MSEPSLYEQIGGAATIDTLVDSFYDRVLSDPELAPFFSNTSMDTLRRMQKQFFTLALGGPPPGRDIDLFKAHSHLKLRRAHLSRFTDHLLETLRKVGVGEDSAMSIVEKIAMYADEVLGDASVDG